MAELHAIGTVVALGGRRYVVVGHRMAPDGERMGIGYVLVPYPLGFVDAESLSVVPASRVEDVVAEGYDAEPGERHLEGLAELAQATSDVPASEYAESLRLLHDFAQEGDAHAE